MGGARKSVNVVTEDACVASRYKIEPAYWRLGSALDPMIDL